MPWRYDERGVGVHLEHPVERVAAPPHDERRLRRELGRERVDRRVELGDRHDALHEPDARAFLGASTRRPVIIRSSAVFGGIERSNGTVIMYGHRPTLISGVPNTASSDGDDQVARAREAEAAGERVAAHPRDDRLAERPHVAEQVGEQPAAVVRRRRAVAFSAMPARSAPAQNALSPAPVSTTTRTSSSARARRHRVAQSLHHAERHRVAALGTIDRHPGHTAADLVQHLVGGHRSRIVFALRLSGVLVYAIAIVVALADPARHPRLVHAPARRAAGAGAGCCSPASRSRSCSSTSRSRGSTGTTSASACSSRRTC